MELEIIKLYQATLDSIVALFALVIHNHESSSNSSPWATQLLGYGNACSFNLINTFLVILLYFASKQVGK